MCPPHWLHPRWHKVRVVSSSVKGPRLRQSAGLAGWSGWGSVWVGCGPGTYSSDQVAVDPYGKPVRTLGACGRSTSRWPTASRLHRVAKDGSVGGTAGRAVGARPRWTERCEDAMPEETAYAPAAFYDDLAASYDRIYPDWEASSRQQGDALHAVIGAQLGPGPHRILDCAVGIGTQLFGLAANGHRLAGSDISAGALRRAQAECRRRGVQAGLAVADMRALPFPDSAFDVVVCADNALPHLLTAADVTRALGEIVRVADSGGLVVVTTRDYDQARKDHPSTTPLSR